MAISSTREVQVPHLVVCVLGAWGHIRPMLGFLARLTKLKHGGVTTLITAKSFATRIEKEWGRHFNEGQTSLQGSLRLRFLEKSEVFRPEDVRTELGPIYSGIIGELGVPHPTVFLTEAISPTTPQIIRELSRRPISFLVWCPTSMNLIYNILEKVENLDQILELLEVQVQGGASFGGAANQVKFIFGTSTDFMLAYKFVTSEANINSQPVKMPDLPPFQAMSYSHKSRPFIAFGDFFIGCMPVLATCDGIVTASSYIVESQACKSVSQMLQKRNNAKFFAIGPLDVIDNQAKAGEIAQSEVAQAVKGFLDNVMEIRGPKSLLYISFGSLFGPTEPEKFITWLQVVQDMGLPMVRSMLTEMQ